MSKNLLPSISPKPTVYPPTSGCDSCDSYLYQLEELEDEVEQLQMDLDSLTEEVDSIPRITVDSELSDFSDNPVENRAISEALEEKQHILIEGNGIDLASDSTISLKPATTSTLGGIKVGNGLVVASDGTLSSTGGSGGGGVADVQMNGTSIVENDIAKVTDDNGNLTIDGDLNLSKGKFVRTQDDSGNLSILGMNSNLITMVGYGPYNASVGETRIYGTGMRFYSQDEFQFNRGIVSSGAITAAYGIYADDIYVKNHDFPIGTTFTDSSTPNVPTGSWHYYIHKSLSAGVYSMCATAQFNPSSTGVRRICWATGASGSESNFSPSIVSQDAVSVSGWGTSMQSATVMTISSQTTVSIGIQQTSGSALSTGVYFRVVQIR